MNVKTITLADGREVSLRLTSKSLCAFNAKHGTAGVPLVANILATTDDLEAKISLLTGALRYPDNANTIKEGDVLLDCLADEGWGRDQVNSLIVELAELAGLITDGEAADLQESLVYSSKKALTSLVDFLNDKPQKKEPQEAPVTQQEDENPT